MSDTDPVAKEERETLPHEKLYDSITYMEESALAALMELRRNITNESIGSKSGLEETKNSENPSLESVIKHSPERIHELNRRMYEEIKNIRNALFHN